MKNRNIRLAITTCQVKYQKKIDKHNVVMQITRNPVSFDLLKLTLEKTPEQ